GRAPSREHVGWAPQVPTVPGAPHVPGISTPRESPRWALACPPYEGWLSGLGLCVGWAPAVPTVPAQVRATGGGFGVGMIWMVGTAYPPYESTPSSAGRAPSREHVGWAPQVP